MRDYFNTLGARVQSLWKDQNYDDLAFQSVASQVLREDPPNKRVSFKEAVEFGILTEPLPYQVDLSATFGQPPLTVYYQHDFRIELLFWTVGLPGIHQHAFSGAFHVMHGSSLHTIWEFEPERKLAHRLLYGKLKLNATEILNTGAVRPIAAGKSYIHSTYHLDRPSVSVVIRTNQEIENSPQYSYLPPCLAYARLEDDPASKRRRQLFKMLAAAGRQKELAEIAMQHLASTDAHSAFAFLLQLPSLFPDKRVQNRVLLSAAAKHGELLECSRPALEEYHRIERIAAVKKTITNPDLQFFLAVLLNVPGREEIFKLVGSRYPRRDAIDRVKLFVRELGQMGIVPEDVAAAACETLSTSAAASNVLTTHWLLRALFMETGSMAAAHRNT